jgi:hypothetical protein
MSREILLRTLSVAALAAFTAPSAFATTVSTINGGGATSPQGDYAGPNNAKGAPTSELSTYNASTTGAVYGTYWGSGSTGQTAFLNNDLTCDINKVTGNNGGKCSNTPGGADTVHYNFSDSALNTTQAAQWSSSSWGQSAAGNLIQIPALGTGEAIVVNDSNIKSNGQLELSDNDLCEIFSGGYTDFSQITDSSTTPAAGAFQFVYRADSAGTTFIITEHLTHACTLSNSNGITFTPTTTFATLFPGGSVNALIPNAVGETGNAGIANYLAGLTGSGTVPQAIGYVAPDWTSVPKAPDTLLSNGKTSPLLVAALFNGTKAYIPSVANLELGLKHIAAVAPGSPSNPPSTAAQGANPLNWIPIIQATSTGYPIVGYGTLDLPQCYSDPTIAAGVIAFLNDHYGSAAYKKIQKNNGLVSVANTHGAAFVTAIKDHILSNKGSGKTAWNIDIQDANACKGLAGR